MKYLYLDQNIWIYLSQVYYGKKTNETYSKLLEKINFLVQKKILVVPINLTNVVEIKKISDKNRREKLARFMADVSKGYCFIPYNYTIDLEIIYFIKNYLKIPVCRIQESAIGIGIFYLIHDGTLPNHTLLDEEKNRFETEMKKLFYTQEVILKVLLDEQSPKDNYESTVKEMERISNINWKYKDKTCRHRMRMFKFLIETFFPRIVHWCKEFNVDTKEIVNRFSSFEEVIDFLKQFPLLYTNICLHNGIEKIPNRPYHVNDIPDIASFCFAIPYCDFVIGEKFLISIARRENLNLLYSTKLYANNDSSKLLADLNDIA